MNHYHVSRIALYLINVVIIVSMVLGPLLASVPQAWAKNPTGDAETTILLPDSWEQNTFPFLGQQDRQRFLPVNQGHALAATTPTAVNQPVVTAQRHQTGNGLNPLAQLPPFVQTAVSSGQTSTMPPPDPAVSMPINQPDQPAALTTQPVDLRHILFPPSQTRPDNVLRSQTMVQIQPASGLQHELFLPVVYNQLNGGIITPESGGQVGMGNITIMFGPGAVVSPANAYLHTGTVHNLPPSLSLVGDPFQLTVQEQGTNDQISYYPPQIITDTIYRSDYDSWTTVAAVTPTVDVSIAYHPSHITGLQEKRLRLYRQDPATGTWKGMPTAVDTERYLIQATIERDGRYALLGWPENNTVLFNLAASPTSTSEPPLVFLDPDHGGIDPGGVVTYPPEFAAQEKHYNLQVAHLVRDRLQSCGLPVEMTREGDDSVSAPMRLNMIQSLQPDATTTLAFDIVNPFMGDSSVTGSGTAAWVDLSKPIQSTFGNLITARVHEHTDLDNRGIRNGSHIYLVMNVDGDVTFTHGELAFMDNFFDRAIMDDPVGMGAIADGAFMGIVDMLGGEDVCEEGFEFPEPLSPEERARLRNLGYQNWDRYRGDPVSVATGNMIQQFTDLWLPGLNGFDFILQRTYNSLDGRAGFFGIGWSSLLDMGLRMASDGSVDVRYADGSGVYFEADGETFTPGQDGVFDRLNRNGPDFMLSTPAQINYLFNADGWLVAVTDRYDNRITLTRDENGRVTQITDSANRTLNLTYDGNRVTSLTDAAGRSITYAYDGDDNLTTITDANNGSHQFQYTGHWMTKLIDPEGIVYLENLYDDQGRIIEQIDASGSHLYFTYDDSDLTDFDDNLGNSTQDHYDDLGRVTQTVDALGQSEQFVYDDDYNVIAYTNKRGHTWTYSYDERGNLLTETDPLGHVTTYTYNDQNDLTSMTDEGGPEGTARTTSYIYDTTGNLIRIDRPDGTRIRATYDDQGQLLSLLDPRGGLTRYQYDAQGNLIQITDPLGNVTTYTYDTLGRQTRITDANGHTAYFAYDDNDNLVQIIDPQGETTSFTYDLNNNLVQMVDRRGGIWTYTYDENLKLTAETTPEGRTLRYEYDAMYNRTRMIDGRDHDIRYHYDALYRLIAVEDALGGITHFGYDENGNVITMTDALDEITTFVYDALDRLVSQTDSLGGTTTFAYDGVGRRINMTNPREATTTYEYDLLDRLILMRDALGGEWTTLYDANGNPIAVTNALGHTVTMQYDANDRLVRHIDAGGNVTDFAHDNVGNVTAVTDALGRTTTYTYDENDNLFTVTDALGGVTTFAYDAEDNLVAITDANNNTIRFHYDQDGLLVRLVEAGGQTTHYAYDAANNLVQATNAKGNAWTYTYDELNRRISETNPLGHTTRYSYDPLSRLTQLTDAQNIATRYEYDSLDRLVAVVQNAQPGQPADYQTNVTTGYDYDPVGNLTTITDARGEQTRFAYDLLDRLVEEINPLGHTWSYGYDAVGNMTERIDARGLSTAYLYDDNNLLTDILYPDGTSIHYTYDAVYNQTSMIDWLGTTFNEYDELNRLLASTNHMGQQVSYSYDAVGNRTSLTYPDGRTVIYEYDANNFQSRMLDPDGNVFVITRDDTHNVTLIDYPNNTTAAYEFDAADRLTAVSNLHDDGSLLSTFAYQLDSVGNRVEMAAEYAWRQPEAITHTYSYDPLYRLARSEDSEDRFTNYAFDPVGNRVEMVTNYAPTLDRTVDVVTTTYTYNGANQLLTAVEDLTPPGTPPPNRRHQVAQMLGAFIHHVEAQHGRHIDPIVANLLLHDANTLLDQLNGTPPPGQAAVDAALTDLENQVIEAGAEGLIGNQGIVTSLLAKLHRAKQANAGQGGEIGVTYYAYDENGNRIQRITPDTRTGHSRDRLRTDYHYDVENRLVHIQDYRDPGTGFWLPRDETFMTYDGYGRLFQRGHSQHIGTGVHQWIDYVYDGLDPIVEYLEPGARYVNYYRGLDRMLSMYKGPGTGEGLLYYFHHDGLGSVSAVSKHLGQSVHNYRYHDYGTILDNNDRAADASNFTAPHNRYTYTGQEWDPNTELFHFYARQYDPQTGTWLQQDSFRGKLISPDTLHRYSYVSNNPIRWEDAYGYGIKGCLIGGLFGGLAGCVLGHIIEESFLQNNKQQTEIPIPDKNNKVPLPDKGSQDSSNEVQKTIVEEIKESSQNNSRYEAYTADGYLYAAPFSSDDYKNQVYVSSGFGPRGEGKHKGVDFAGSAISGTNVYSITHGTVEIAGWDNTCGKNYNEKCGEKEGYGYLVKIKHSDDRYSLYAHLREQPTVNVGDSVNPNTVIGIVGSTGHSTGPHLHLEIREKSSLSSATDPFNYIPRVPVDE